MANGYEPFILQAKRAYDNIGLYLSEERVRKCPPLYRLSVLIDRPATALAHVLVAVIALVLLLNPLNVAPLVVNVPGTVYPAYKTILNLVESESRVQKDFNAKHSRFLDYWVLFVGSVVFESFSQHLLGFYLGGDEVGWSIDAAGIDLVLPGYWMIKTGLMVWFILREPTTRRRAAVAAPSPIQISSGHRTPAENLSSHTRLLKTTMEQEVSVRHSGGSQPESTGLRSRQPPIPSVQGLGNFVADHPPSPIPIFTSPVQSEASPRKIRGEDLELDDDSDSDDETETSDFSSSNDSYFNFTGQGQVQDRVPTPGSGVEKQDSLYQRLTPGGLPRYLHRNDVVIGTADGLEDEVAPPSPDIFLDDTQRKRMLEQMTARYESTQNNKIPFLPHPADAEAASRTELGSAVASPDPPGDMAEISSRPSILEQMMERTAENSPISAAEQVVDHPETKNVPSWELGSGNAILPEDGEHVPKVEGE